MIKIPLIENENSLFIFLLHLISDRFPKNAILKGGMVLKLLGSNRKTLDLDYVFVPYKSKKDVLEDIEGLFREVDGLNYKIKLNSKMIKINIEVEDIRSQIEINVSEEIKSDVISTSLLSGRDRSVSPRIIRIMSLDVAMAHKLAAWNERRLLRDLYDTYYFLEVQGILPDMDTLNTRLLNVQSRRPSLKKIKKMSLGRFKEELRKFVYNIKFKDIEDELSPLVEKEELPGLDLKIKHSVNLLLQRI